MTPCLLRASARWRANEVKLLELWIAAGASSTLAANGIKGAPTNEVPVVAEVTFPEIDPAAVRQVARSTRSRGCQLQTALPGPCGLRIPGLRQPGD